MASAPAARCIVCGAAPASPTIGHVSPLCRKHELAWRESPEHARAATARADFVSRVKAEEVAHG